ncbi:DUF2244 domain-containing protein [Maritimibacter sp. 55A14]|uniref:DUF2244 domain-containing protein n=1 Tax=Maritimibacter sp. 55A14 TaxID=2174844 RepID=UPI001E4CBFEE|nr:DUF2244 domain-containing protein [Maritimibacter sp. 55A14]
MLRPNRSLSPQGFVVVIGLCFGFMMIPLIPLLGTMALWAMLPFLLGAIALLWYFIRRNTADGALTERLVLSDRLIRVTRHNPRGPAQEWQANPYWTSLTLHATGGPVENYITLKGSGREIELGAFLSPEERAALHAELEEALARARATATPGAS